MNKPIEARWKGAGFGDYMCSYCSTVVSGQPDECPECGALMDKVDDGRDLELDNLFEEC